MLFFRQLVMLDPVPEIARTANGLMRGEHLLDRSVADCVNHSLQTALVTRADERFYILVRVVEPTACSIHERLAHRRVAGADRPIGKQLHPAVPEPFVAKSGSDFLVDECRQGWPLRTEIHANPSPLAGPLIHGDVLLRRHDMNGRDPQRMGKPDRCIERLILLGGGR